MCKCLENLKKELKEQLPEKNKDFKDKEITNVSFDNEVFYFSGKTDLVVPFTAEYLYTNKKGETKTKKKKLNMKTDNCPFCGEKREV